MSQVTYRANLSAKSFPFISANWGRTIIVPQYDNTYNRVLASQADRDADVGIPQVYYCHNVMPHGQGFQTVGYTILTPGPGLGHIFAHIYLLRAVNDTKHYLVQANNGDLYLFNGTTWTFLFNKPFAQITVAYVSGNTYIYISNIDFTGAACAGGCYIYDPVTPTINVQALTAVPIGTPLGIVGSAGYLILYNSTQVAWSSTIDPTDFTPSLVTGAGYGSVEGTRGTIVGLVSHTLGFFVYTTANVVVGLYSGNSRFPFNFREIVGSGGISSLSSVSVDANTGNQYAYTTSGLQLISSTQTQTIFPEVTDFISGQTFEDYDTITDTFVTQTISTTLLKDITVISDRYLVISYGVTALTHALVYDFILQRWGKLRIEHVKCFEYRLPNAGVTEIPRQSIAFLQTDGDIRRVNFSTEANWDPGYTTVIFLGKYQFVRQRLLQLDEVHIENVSPKGTFSVTNLYALDGKNTQAENGYLLDSAGEYRHYGFSNSIGVNHSLRIKGQILLESLVLVFHIDAKR